MANLSNINNKFIVQDNSRILVNKTSDTGATLQVGGSLSTDTSVRVGNGVLYVGDGGTATARIMGYGDTEMITGVSGATYLRVSGTSTLSGTLQAGQYILATGLAYGAVNSYTQIINGSTGAITGTSASFSGNVILGGGYLQLDTNDNSRISGDNDSIDFILWDNNSSYQTRMVIKDTGNVGIGTSSPSNKLDVQITTSNRTTLEPVLSVSASGSGPYTGFGPKISFDSNIYYGAATGNPAGIIETAYIGAVMGTTYATNSDLVFATRDGATSVTEKMRILGNGNIGIANQLYHLGETTNNIAFSTGNFDVNMGGSNKVNIDAANTYLNNNNVLVNNNGGSLVIDGTGASELRMAGPNGYYSFMMSTQVRRANAITWSRLGTDGSPVNDAVTADLMTLSYTGNLGIGTTSPNTKLEISGNASTRNALSNVLTLNGGGTVANPYDGFGVGTVFKGLDYSNASRDYAYIYAVIENQTSSSTPAGDPGFKSQLRFYTNTGGASSTLPTEKMRISSSGMVGIGMTPDPIASSTYMLQMYNPGSQCFLSLGNGTSGSGPLNGLVIGNDTTSTYIFNREATSMQFGTNNSTKMLIESGGNVGIGTTSPNAKLQIDGNLRVEGLSSGTSASFGGSGDFAIDAPGVGGGRFMVKHGGNVGIGENNPSYQLEIGGTANPKIAIVSNINSATSSLYFGDSDAKDRGQIVYTHFGDFMQFNVGGGTRLYLEAGINTAYTSDGLFNSNATPSYWNHGNGQFKLGYMDNGSGLYSGAYAFNVKSTDGIPVTGREIGAIFINDVSSGRRPLRISNQGRITIDQTNTSTDYGSGTGWLTIANGTGAYNFYNAYTGTDGGSGCARYRLNNTSPSFFDFYYTTTQVGYITTNGTDIFYANTSDYRLKEDLKSFDGMSLLEQIQVYDFKWKESDNRMYGVVAHELQEVVPQAVVGDKDQEKLQAVDYSKLVPILIKSIQELKAEIELLKNN